MSQLEIFKFLKEHKGEWFTTSSLSKFFPDINRSSICCNVPKLGKYSEIELRRDYGVFTNGIHRQCFGIRYKKREVQKHKLMERE